MTEAAPPPVPYALVVDDEPLFLMHASEILENVGFRTLEAIGAEEALDILEHNAGAIGLLFTDVQMKGVDGFELARRVAATWSDVVIVVMSGQRKPTAADLPAGATFITKPFSAEMVRAHLDVILPDGSKPEPLKRRTG